jgi:hypothetical protein
MVMNPVDIKDKLQILGIHNIFMHTLFSRQSMQSLLLGPYCLLKVKSAALLTSFVRA